MCLLRSFASKGFCNVTFNWQYYYYYLTAEGIKYIREYLGLPDNVVPATLKKAALKSPLGMAFFPLGPAGAAATAAFFNVAGTTLSGRPRYSRIYLIPSAV